MGIATSGNRPPTVTVYTQRCCAPCHFTLRWLRDHGVVHRVIDVDGEAGARERLRALGHTRTPVVVTADGASWAGHSVALLAGLLPDDEGRDVTAAMAGAVGR